MTLTLLAQKKKCIGRDPPWYNNDIKNARKERGMGENTCKINKFEANTIAFCKSRNKVSRLICEHKKLINNLRIQQI